jgi:hypothetical protein
MACTGTSWAKFGAWILTIYSIATFGCLIAYSRYELDNHIINGVGTPDNYNNGVPVILMNVSNLVSTLFFARALFQIVYKPSPYNQQGQYDCTDFEVIYYNIAGWGQIAVGICAFVAFGYNCHYSFPCYTVVSPLYLLVLIYVHMIFLIAVIATAFLLTVGLWQLCQCSDIFFSQQQNNDPKVDTEPLLINVHMKYESVSTLKKRDTDSKCSICHGDYIATDIIEVMKNCSHYFHKDCIDTWFKKHVECTCPVCKVSNK